MRRLVDFQNLVQKTRVHPPEKFKTKDDFNTALANHILAHPSLTLMKREMATTRENCLRHLWGHSALTALFRKRL
ncbi:MAG: hypothetical protein VX941_02355 [Pseudomonadota bacterium]|nr:hypothetical protein [Pseudomonadota bacterium]